MDSPITPWHPSSDTLASARSWNVSGVERLFSLLAGVASLAVAAGMANGKMRKAISTVLGGYLIYRGVTGMCPLMQRSGMRTSARFRPDLERRFGERTRDMVEEASWESFPASDPPAW